MKAFGVIISVILIIFGAAFPIPKKHIYVSNYSYDTGWVDEKGEGYVGGDAYNYQIEASLKGGWVSGVLAMKAISVSSGILLFFFVMYADKKQKELEKQTKLLEQISGKSAENATIHKEQPVQPAQPAESLAD
ncbi:MAG: hypothetical protein ACI4KR_12345 [Ruminiclostridium sp.]